MAVRVADLYLKGSQLGELNRTDLRDDAAAALPSWQTPATLLLSMPYPISEEIAVYNSTAPSLNNGDNSPLQLDAASNLKVTQATLLAGEELTNNVMKVENRFSYAAITTATTTTVKSGAGFLHRLVVTGGTAGTVVVYDNTAGSGTQIANFDSASTMTSYEFNVAFSTGLTIVTGAATKVTVAHR